MSRQRRSEIWGRKTNPRNRGPSMRGGKKVRCPVAREKLPNSREHENLTSSFGCYHTAAGFSRFFAKFNRTRQYSPKKGGLHTAVNARSRVIARVTIGKHNFAQSNLFYRVLGCLNATCDSVRTASSETLVQFPCTSCAPPLEEGSI